MNLLIITFLIGSLAALNQDPIWVANVNSGPLLILAKGRAISIQNNTDQAVISFRLGCIEIKTRRIVVIHHFPIEKTAIPPHGETIKASFDGFPDEQVRCQGVQAKLAVLETAFENKDTWRLPLNSPFAARKFGVIDK
jgi:hypothetical protein